MTTARDIVKRALRKIHVLGTGQQLSNEDAQRGFNTLNEMIAVDSTDGYYVFNDTLETFSLVSGQASYTFGTGGQDFNTARPLSISSAYVTGGSTDYPLTKYDSIQYSKLAQKETQGVTSVYYYDSNYPIPKIFLYPAPAGVTTITINSQKELAQFASLDTEFTFPPEYEAYLVYNLAVWISPEYERQPSAQVIQIANKTRSAIEAQNVKNTNFVSTIDAPTSTQSGSFDILSGDIW